MAVATALDKRLTTALSADAVEALSASLDEPDWLRDHRLAALVTFNALDWPTPDEEEWRRTPLDGVPLEGWDLPGAEGTPIPAVLTSLAVDEAGGLIHSDGSALVQTLDAAVAAQGVRLLPLSQAAREYEPIVRDHLNTVASVDYDRFTALSAALWSQGLFCYIPHGVTVERTLLHLITKRAGASALGHTLVVAEAGSVATLVEACASEGSLDSGPSLVHHTIELALGDAARVKLGRLQQWDASTNAFLTARGRLGRDANLVLASVDFGGRLSKERLEVDLDGNGSHAELVGLFVGRNAQHIEHNTRQIHRGVGGSSELLIKGALDDNAAAVQYGIIKILPEGQKTAGFQTMRNLLLSEGASADPIPVLEIEADDVQCSHAAAVGPVDPDHIFYLQSRGIPPEPAERMVVQGFLEVVAQRLPDAQLRNAVVRLIDAKLDAPTKTGAANA